MVQLEESSNFKVSTRKKQGSSKRVTVVGVEEFISRELTLLIVKMNMQEMFPQSPVDLFPSWAGAPQPSLSLKVPHKGMNSSLVNHVTTASSLMEDRMNGMGMLVLDGRVIGEEKVLSCRSLFRLCTRSLPLLSTADG